MAGGDKFGAYEDSFITITAGGKRMQHLFRLLMVVHADTRANKVSLVTSE